jgi:alpha-galactosidase
MMKTTFDTHDSWESMLTNLHSTVNLPTYQRHGYFNMPDMLSIGQGGQTQAQYRAQMLLWSVMGAPLIRAWAQIFVI